MMKVQGLPQANHMTSQSWERKSNLSSDNWRFPKNNFSQCMYMCWTWTKFIIFQTSRIKYLPIVWLIFPVREQPITASTQPIFLGGTCQLFLWYKTLISQTKFLEWEFYDWFMWPYLGCEYCTTHTEEFLHGGRGTWLLGGGPARALPPTPGIPTLVSPQHQRLIEQTCDLLGHKVFILIFLFSQST